MNPPLPNTQKGLLSETSFYWQMMYSQTFLVDSPYINFRLNLSTTSATFFGGDVQLYIKLLT